MFFAYLVLNDYYTIFFSQLQLSIDNLLYFLIYLLSEHFGSCKFIYEWSFGYDKNYYSAQYNAGHQRFSQRRFKAGL